MFQPGPNKFLLIRKQLFNIKVKMIDPVLKKFGLSQARKSVKNLSNQSYSRTPRKGTTPNTSQRKLNHNQSIAQTARQKPKEQPQTTLSRLIKYLKSYYNKPCPHHSHVLNKIKFICLNEPCSQNLGCAECFLYKHSDHPKAEISTCLRQLEELECYMRDSYETIISQKTVIKKHFIKQIDLQINHMCDQFHRNLQFMKNKALKQIDDHLFAKYQEFQILSVLRNQGSQKYSEQLIIGELMKIDIKGIQNSLNTQLKELSYQKLNLQPLIKYFEEMNGSLGHFMAQFKKCFPKIYVFHEETFNESKYLTKPDPKFHNLVSQFKSNQNDQLQKGQTYI